MTTPLPADAEGRLSLAAREKLEPLLAEATCIACGPGLGRTAELTEIVGWLYGSVQQPMVLDADALFALAQLAAENKPAAAGPRILTPHPGEFARLVPQCGKTRDEQIQAAKELARAWGVVILLKGHRTLITDGTRSAFNATGNPGMATGGCGDVLTGIITALVCQQLSPFDAAVLGAHVHGLAGDLTAAELGEVSLIASDLVRYLPPALQAVA
jgi:NAD(P)H-hydrate epimerase